MYKSQAHGARKVALSLKVKKKETKKVKNGKMKSGKMKSGFVKI